MSGLIITGQVNNIGNSTDGRLGLRFLGSEERMHGCIIIDLNGSMSGSHSRCDGLDGDRRLGLGRGRVVLGNFAKAIAGDQLVCARALFEVALVLDGFPLSAEVFVFIQGRGRSVALEPVGNVALHVTNEFHLADDIFVAKQSEEQCLHLYSSGTTTVEHEPGSKCLEHVFGHTTRGHERINGVANSENVTGRRLRVVGKPTFSLVDILALWIDLINLSVKIDRGRSHHLLFLGGRGAHISNASLVNRDSRSAWCRLRDGGGLLGDDSGLRERLSGKVSTIEAINGRDIDSALVVPFLCSLSWSSCFPREDRDGWMVVKNCRRGRSGTSC